MKKVAILIFLCACIFLSGCHFTPTKASRDFFSMNTVMNITVYGNNHQQDVDDAVSAVYNLESLFSQTKTGSDIDKLNKSDGELTQLSETTIQIIEQSQKYSELTNGSFDITVGSLVKLWNITGVNPYVPSQQAILERIALVNYKEVLITGNRVSIKKGMSLDLGGIGKGYASEEIVNILKQRKVNSALINLGGNIAVIGKNSDGRDFRIAIQNPKDVQDSYIGYVSVSDKYIITSGDYQRYFEQDGKRYCHILDPKTGYPAASNLHSVTIISDSGTQADALSTALFVMGYEKAINYYQAHKDFEAIFITSDNKILCTDGIKSLFTFTGANEGFTYEA